MTEQEPDQKPDEPPVQEPKPNPLGVRNVGEPILLSECNMHGVAGEAARGGDTVQIITRLMCTSDQPIFHEIAPNIASVIRASAQADGKYVSLERASTVLLVMRPDNTAELWIDSAAVIAKSRLKRPGPMKAGTVLFESDIADVTGLWFPFVEIGPKDRVLCIMREGWRFGLFFDFNPDGELGIAEAERALGTLSRRMRYADLYAAVAHEPTFKRMVELGWFPFLELMSGEFKELVGLLQAGFEIDAEKQLLAKFDDARIERMFARWMERPALKEKEVILRSAVDSFKRKDAVAAIKVILSEIEGAMAVAYERATGEHTTRIPKLLDFVVDNAKRQAGGADTLLFPTEFATYLRNYTYAGFNPGDVKGAGSRHAVGHGAVKAESYTLPRALQALLTFDQLAFYN